MAVPQVRFQGDQCKIERVIGEKAFLGTYPSGIPSPGGSCVAVTARRAALAEVRVDAHVQADETSVRTQTRKERSFVWTFLSHVHTVYVFSASRSGDTPKVVLGGTQGALTIDGYTGYNVVTDVEGRDRSGCWSHARRHVFDALATAPEAREGLDIILDLFMVERDAAGANIIGTAAHLELRRAGVRQSWTASRSG